jgi:hypothetical protein
VDHEVFNNESPKAKQVTATAFIDELCYSGSHLDGFWTSNRIEPENCGDMGTSAAQPYLAICSNYCPSSH